MSEVNAAVFGGFEDVTNAAKKALTPKRPEKAPYESSTLPRDVLQFLPPNGEPFSLFGDPYAQMHYVESRTNIIRASQYWLRGKMEDNNFTDYEVALLTFLSKHKVTTRSQIRSALFEITDSDIKVRDFIKKMLRHGVLVPFKWVTPCRLLQLPEYEAFNRKTPQLYGLSPVAAQAAINLIPYARIDRKFQFIPTRFVTGQAPTMINYFEHLIANEFYCRLHAMDRVIEWDISSTFELPSGSYYRPHSVIKTIKDENDYKYFWLEVVRPRAGWYEHTQGRLRHIEAAINKLPEEFCPEVVVILVDNVSRIPEIAELVELYLPSAEVRYSTDERVLQKESDALFYKYSKEKGATLSKIKHLTFDWMGLTASEYHHKMIESFSFDADDLDDDDDY